MWNGKGKGCVCLRRLPLPLSPLSGSSSLPLLFIPHVPFLALESLMLSSSFLDLESLVLSFRSSPCDRLLQDG
jgi:hypothetical protein